MPHEILKKPTLTTCVFDISDVGFVKEKVLNWSQQFDTFCFLDNHQYNIPPHTEEWMLAAGVKRAVSANAGTALDQLQDFIDERSCWLFGHLGYDLKNEIEKLQSSRHSGIDFPDLFFFEPEVLVRLQGKQLEITSDVPGRVYQVILKQPATYENSKLSPAIESRLNKQQYISIIRKLKQHILRGDCYEINFCTEFFGKEADVNPLFLYHQLSRVSPNPFSALYRRDNQWLVCASPERYLKRQGNRILSQPIKGTAKRVKDNDESTRELLYNSAKDRSENVMVVDLVRNDLAKFCKGTTVKVDELFGIYSFPQVHQMISTVSGDLEENILFKDIIRASFPMGSMTGAPKKRVMELIEEYEPVRRGIFSGAVGYIKPDGDFDFNVVIRSIMYNQSAKYLSFQSGSGITFYSDPENEWEECLLKAAAIRNVIEGSD